jgi:hypothetical protein
MRLLALSLLVLTFGASCAKEETSDYDWDQVYKVPTSTLEAAQKLARTAEISCASNGQCSPSVGLVTFASSDGAGQCTGTLVGPGLIATNDHCVPEDLTEGASCSNRIWVTFNDAPGMEKRLSCAKVIKRHKNYTENNLQDYAFLQMKEVSVRPALRISRLGISDGTSIKVEKVNPVKSSSRVAGQQETTKCNTVQNSALFPGYNSDYAPFAFFTNCVVIGGNSGSSMVASDGTVRGVVFATIVEENLRKVMRNKKLSTAGGYLSPAGMGTNFACLDLPREATSDAMPSFCNLPRVPSASKKMETAEIDAKVKNLIYSLSLQQEPVRRFNWDYEIKDDQVELKPTCFRKGDDSATYYRMPSRTWNMETTLDNEYRFQSVSLTAADFYSYVTISGQSAGIATLTYIGSGDKKEFRLGECR